MKLSEIKEKWTFIENIGSTSYWLENTEDGTGATISPREVLEIGCQLEADKENITEQLHRVARERDKERELRLKADDALFAKYMEVKA